MKFELFTMSLVVLFYCVRNMGSLFIYFLILNKWFLPDVIQAVRRESWFWFQGNEQFVIEFNERLNEQIVARRLEEDLARIVEA